MMFYVLHACRSMVYMAHVRHVRAEPLVTATLVAPLNSLLASEKTPAAINVVTFQPRNFIIGWESE